MRKPMYSGKPGQLATGVRTKRDTASECMLSSLGLSLARIGKVASTAQWRIPCSPIITRALINGVNFPGSGEQGRIGEAQQT